ncbi:Spy/CpxP family protein refolding chaperone [bacterium]|nr:Spy/CpxP family protein refolding chaperone [bacterium]
MKKLLTTAFCLSIIFIGTQSVFAAESSKTYSTTNSTTTERKAPPDFNRENRQKPPMPKLEEELNLTDAQKEQARQNRIKGRSEMKPIMEKIHAKKEAVLDIMDSDLSEEKKQEQIKAIQAELKELHVKANTIREKNMAEFEKILTKEQKTKFEQLKKEKEPIHECKRCGNKMPPPPMD